MFARLPVVALAALSAVNASPLAKRQSSAVSSAVESATSAASSAVESATSAVDTMSSTMMSSTMMSSDAASTGASTDMSSTMSSAAATSTGMTTGNQSYPLYPCPTGFLLTYVEQNVTIDMPVTNVTSALGDWATSPIFPNVTASNGASDVGATHTLNVGGVDLMETLVDVMTNETSGYAMWNWNLTNGPVTAMNVSVSNYSTVLSVYDPDFTTTGMIGNSTVAQIFVNFCASEQAAGISLVGTLTQLELGTLEQVVASNGTAMPSSTSSAAPESTTAMSSTDMSSTDMSSTMMSSGATDSATSAAASATSGAASAVSDATSAVASAASTSA